MNDIFDSIPGQRSAGHFGQGSSVGRPADGCGEGEGGPVRPARGIDREAGRALAATTGHTEKVARSTELGFVGNYRARKIAQKELEQFVVVSLRGHYRSLVQMQEARRDLAVTLVKEGLAAEYADAKNQLRLTIDAFLAQLQQALLVQQGKQIDAVYDHLEAVEAKLLGRYGDGSPRLAERLGQLEDDTKNAVSTIRSKVERIMQKACAEFDASLRT